MTKQLAFLIALTIISFYMPFNAHNQLQTYAPASFWSVCARNGYTHETDNKNRNIRGELFIEDMHQSLDQNKLIPQHHLSEHAPLIRIATYNVRLWTDPLDTLNIEAILETIKSVNADILILQETIWDDNMLGSLHSAHLVALFRQLGYQYGGLDTLSHAVWKPEFVNYGTVIFSKFPLHHVQCTLFEPTLPGADKRGYTTAQVHIGETTISIYATHLAAESTAVVPAAAEDVRLEQIKQLIEQINHDQSKNIFIAADCNAVRLKDFNYEIDNVPAWKLVDDDYIGYVGVHRPTHALAYLETLEFKNSFDQLHIPTPKTTTWSGIPVDHIFLAKTWSLALDGSYMFFSDASDHCPVICDVILSDYSD